MAGAGGYAMSVGAAKGSWVYDYAEDELGKIIAINYHISDGSAISPECLSNDHLALTAEGLTIHCSARFESLEAARTSAWDKKDDFDKGLD